MSIPRLNDIMMQLIASHESLLALAKEKTPVLVLNRIEQLNQIVNRESKLVKQVSQLDQDRIEAIGAFLAEKGFRPSSNISVNEISKLVFNAEEKRSLLDVHERLLTLIEELREVNALNQQLIVQSLAFIDYSLDLVLGGPEDDAVYSNPANQTNNPRRKGMFDSRA